MKTYIVVSLSLLVAGLGCAVPGVDWRTAVLMGFVSAVACELLHMGWEAFQQGQQALLEDCRRLFSAWREIMSEGPMVRVLYMTGFAAAFLWFLLTLAANRVDDNFAVWISFALLAAGGAVSFSIRLGRLLRLTWSAVVGKILALTAGTALIAISVALAKRIVHSLVHVDPKYFIEFTAILAAFILPYLWAVAAVGLLILYTVGQFAVFVMFVLITGTLHPLRDFINIFRPDISNHENAWDHVRQRNRVFAEMVARIIGTLALACGLGKGVEILGQLPPYLGPHLKALIVFMEYRGGSACGDLEALPVAYLDNELVSVATLVDGEYRFAVTKCRLGPE